MALLNFRNSGERNNMAERRTKAAGAGETEDLPPMTAEQFEACLSEGFATSLAIGGLEVGECEPAQEGSASNSGGAGRVVNVRLSEQRGNGVLLFTSEI
jgi:hypothetical protein